jgi:hypothetical protein
MQHLLQLVTFIQFVVKMLVFFECLKRTWIILHACSVLPILVNVTLTLTRLSNPRRIRTRIRIPNVTAAY